MIKLGLLGIGRIGRIHLQHINRHFEDATVVAAMSPSEPGRAFARQLGVPFVTDDALAVIRHPMFVLRRKYPTLSCGGL